MRPRVITQWVAQDGRRPEALRPGYAPFDDRSLADLLAQAPRMARRVRYFDEEARPDGDWSGLFLADSAILLSSIATLDLGPAADRLRALRTEPGDGAVEEFVQLCEAFALMMEVVWTVDGWLVAVDRLPPAEAATGLLDGGLEAAVRRDLAPLLQRLSAWGLGAGEAVGEAILLDRQGLHSAWGPETAVADASIYIGHDARGRLRAAMPEVADLFARMAGVVAEISAAARRALDEDLRRPDHPPHTALYTAFTGLFQTVQAELNRLPERLATYYHRDLLGEPTRAAVPDRVYLTVATPPAAGPIRIPAGTAFPAGVDAAGRAVTFRANHELAATGATLARLRATRIVRATGLPEDLAGRAGLVTGLWCGEIGPEGLAAGWPAPATADTPSPDLQPAPLGFLAVSPDLAMAGGQRRLTLRLRLAPAAPGGARRALLDRIEHDTGLAAEAALGAVFARAFDYALTGAAGWIPVAPVADAAAAAPGTVPLIFDLGPADPAVAPLAAPFAGDPARRPALRARLRQAAVDLTGPKGTLSLPPLALLDGLEILSLDARRAVRGLTGVVIDTPDGPVDGSAPFAPFGSPARRGAGLTLRHPELDGRSLEGARLTLDWTAVPAHPHGFTGHYAQYVIGPDRLPVERLFDNRTFRVVFAGADGVGQKTSLFAADAQGAVPPVEGPVWGASWFSLARTSGPLTLSLTDPAYGFGDDLYPINLLNAVQPDPVAPDSTLFAPTLEAVVREPPSPWRRFTGALMRLWRKLFHRQRPPEADAARAPPDVTRTYPNPPWRLQVGGASVDYEAAFALTPDGRTPAEFHHLTPFGAAVAVTASGSFRLLADPGDDDALDLGFLSLPTPGPLTLLVQVGAAPAGPDAPGGLIWRGRDGAGWRRLPPHAIAADETWGLMTTGLLSLVLPRLAPDADGLTWLRASGAAGPSNPPLTAVTPDALSADRAIDPASQTLAPIAALTIKAPAPPIPGVAAVVQPLASFGGRPPEDPAALPVRLGERLRHRGRAVTLWDYERLVLDRFPEIDRVHAVAGPRAGEVTLAVIPVRDAAATDAPRAPAALKGRIADLLAGTASPFARLRVVDPAYVRIKVRARVSYAPTAPVDAARRLNQALRDLLSPWSSLRLPERAGPREIRARVLDFVQTRPEVAAVAALDLIYDPDPATLDGWTPTSAAEHEIIDADLSAPPITESTP